MKNCINFNNVVLIMLEIHNADLPEGNVIKSEPYNPAKVKRTY